MEMLKYGRKLDYRTACPLWVNKIIPEKVEEYMNV